jgi:hypothetical protein
LGDQQSQKARKCRGSHKDRIRIVLLVGKAGVFRRYVTIRSLVRYAAPVISEEIVGTELWVCWQEQLTVPGSERVLKDVLMESDRFMQGIQPNHFGDPSHMRWTLRLGKTAEGDVAKGDCLLETEDGRELN